jgi:hypothetical protein
MADATIGLGGYEDLLVLLWYHSVMYVGLTSLWCPVERGRGRGQIHTLQDNQSRLRKPARMLLHRCCQLYQPVE